MNWRNDATLEYNQIVSFYHNVLLNQNKCTGKGVEKIKYYVPNFISIKHLKGGLSIYTSWQTKKITK